MLRYDPGLKIVAAAQKAAAAGKYEEAHDKFVKGIEELVKLLQIEQDEGTKNLVRKHVGRFLVFPSSLSLSQNALPLSLTVSKQLKSVRSHFVSLVHSCFLDRAHALPLPHTYIHT